MTERKAGAVSEAQAWRECAEWCGTGVPRYLCNLLSEPPHRDVPTIWPLAAMRKRLDAHADMHDYFLCADGDWGSTLDVCNRSICPQDDRNDTRVIFCLLMAHECEGGSDA